MCNPVTTAHPDALLAKGESQGYEWEVTRNHSGYRCGYVRIPQGHPWHGKDDDEIAPDVHGGITFAAADTHCGKGGADDAWWLGFDCAHYGDAPDPALTDHTHLWPHYEGETVKTTEYVKAECLHLIEQAVAADG